MAQVGWGDVKTSKTSGTGAKTGDLFLKLDAGRHRIRLVGKPHEMWLVWINKKKYVVPESYISRLEHIGCKPRLHYAINVFDRADTDKGECKLKILEKGTQVFQFFSTYFNELEIDPGSAKGPDWKIIVDVPQDRRQTEYKALAIGETPFTQEEITLLTRPKNMAEEDLKKLPLGERGLIDLAKFYNEENAAKQLDEILAKATGTSTDTVDSVAKKAGEGDSLDNLLGNDEDEVETKKETNASTKAKPSPVESTEDLDDLLANAF